MSPPALQEPRGFSHLAIATASTIVAIAGQTPVDAGSNVVGVGNLAAQTRAAMRNLEAALLAVELGWHHVLNRRVYTTQPTRFVVIAEAIEEVTGPMQHPPQTLIGVSGLARPEFLIEIEATAVK